MRVARSMLVALAVLLAGLICMGPLTVSHAQDPTICIATTAGNPWLSVDPVALVFVFDDGAGNETTGSLEAISPVDPIDQCTVALRGEGIYPNRIFVEYDAYAGVGKRGACEAGYAASFFALINQVPYSATTTNYTAGICGQ
ncbi:MAG TPA: hypothetical protein VI756_15385 [Blastocatellia bacterium]